MRKGLALSLFLAACAAPAPDAPIRDIRPLQIERGDTVTVEASGPLFVAGAETKVWLDALKLEPLPARAVSTTRVLFDADLRLEKAIEARGGHVVGETPVTVEQTVGGRKVVLKSAASAPFEIDLFPRTLHKVAARLADRTGATEGLFEWLGATVEAGQGGVVVKDVVTGFDKEAFFLRYDTPPLDGQVTRDEAKKGGLSEREFARLDEKADGVIHGHEVEHLPTTDGFAAKAGMLVGDVIVAANGKGVATPAELAGAWEADGEAVNASVKRGGAIATLSLPRAGRPSGIPAWIVFAICMALAAGIIALPVPVIGGLIVVWERKISAYMQVRIGPNRVGPNGWLQWLADGLKLIMKEDLVPTEADPYLFRASPYLAFVGLFLVFMVIPFTGWLIVADLNIGLLFLLSVTSLIVVSMIMGGWSSNSKWSLLGGMRSAAQIISYELPASVALLGIATLTGSLSMEAIVRAQGGEPWNWYVFRNPFLFVAFYIWFVSALAEGNRTPFDLPEAESELVAGYFTEYSGFRFSLFPLVEWVNLFVIGAVGATLFLGGWQVPFVSLATQDASGWLQAVGFLILLAKTIGIIFIIIWIRWTLPRFRVDQMMNLCWKYFIPISFGCFLGTLVLAWIAGSAIWVDYGMRVVTFVVGGILPLVVFVKKVQYNRGRFQAFTTNQALWQ